MIRNLSRIQNIPEDLAELCGGHKCVRFEYEHARTYLTDADTITLQIALSVDNNPECLIAEQFPEDVDTFERLASSLRQQPIKLNSPLALDPVYIPKPWGREIWFSGIEERGISTCQGTPIAWLLDIFGKQLGCQNTPLLLKILDPLPTENIGDLYFELHEKKIEVYVVTHIDLSAWPDGVGQIRYGFNQSLLAEYGSEADFLDDYRKAVKDYEQVRRAIDTGTSELAVVETRLRQEMYRFTSLQPIRQGDVITVEPFVPHSLQHGVRVLELQTPHYERRILSFGQKVVTQDHWDTDEALEVAKLNGDPFSSDGNDNIIANFDEFLVERIKVEAGDTKELIADKYQILVGIEGSLNCGTDALLTPESAWFLPPRKQGFQIRNSIDQTGVFLRATET